MNSKKVHRIKKINITDLLTIADKKEIERQLLENKRLYNSLNYLARMKYFYLIDKEHKGLNYTEIERYKVNDWVAGDNIYI